MTQREGSTQPHTDGSGVGAGAVTVDADGREIPVDLAAWIDDHDPPAAGEGGRSDDEDPSVDAPDGPDDASADTRDTGDTGGVEQDAARVLDAQRAVHEPASRDAGEAIGALVNNTGDDGGAASG